MESIFGLPAHPFFVHVPIVLVPLVGIGAIVMTTEPVLAQKDQLPDAAPARNPTSMMGAGPAVQPRKRTKAQLDADRLREAEEIMRGGAGTLQEK